MQPTLSSATPTLSSATPTLSSATPTLRQQLAVRAPSRPASWFVADYPPHFEPFGAWVRACNRARDTQWPWAWADAVLAEQARPGALHPTNVELDDSFFEPAQTGAQA